MSTVHGMYGSPENQAWRDIKQRCENPNNPRYPRYGGRGIIMCDRWRNSFSKFIQNMGPRPGPNFSIERVDNNGHYTPKNCRWATREEQYRNRSTTNLITHNGITLSSAEWSRKLGCTKSTVADRLKCGWSIEDAVTLPKYSWNPKRLK